MKRVFLALLVVVVVIILLFFFRQKSNRPAMADKSTATNTVAILEATNNSRALATMQVAKPIIASAEKVFDLNKAKSLADWTNAIPNFTISTHTAYVDSWVMEQDDPAKYPSMLLMGKNGEDIQYEAKFVNIETTDHIRRIEIHSPNLDIKAIKSLGDSLLRVMDKNESNFNSWCNKVGNRWMDQPQFSSGNAHLPNDERTYVFEALPTFNNEKPWYILLVITDK